MPLWGSNDASSNTVKTVASYLNVGSGKVAEAANNTALFDNVTRGAFISDLAVGVFAVSAAEVANTTGESKRLNHAGWNLRRAWSGPVESLAINAGGTGYNNTDLVRVSGGSVNASATVSTNSTGGLTSVTITNRGGGFINVSSSTVAVTNATGGATGGSTGTFVLTLGGRAGRVHYETLVAMGSIAGDASDDTQLPE